MKLIYKVESNISINDILTKELNISTRLKNKLIKNKHVLLNNIFVDTRNIAHIEDIVTINLDYCENISNVVPTKMKLDIIYEDEHILAINKPAGIAVHPSILHFNDSLANGVRYYFDSIGLKKKIRAVNRIDLNTSGLVLFAKNEYVQECLIKQMSSSTFEKTYIAVVYGKLPKGQGTINVPIARKENSIIERCVSKEGQTAITHYKVLKEFETFSLVQCTLETGRTHQIRVHMAHIGNPLLGDSLYSSISLNLIKRQALHSFKMNFVHPITGEKISLEAKPPKDIKTLISQ